MAGTLDTATDGTALDLLEREDAELQLLFDRLARTRGPSVEMRAEHGDLAKQLVRHVATREAALTDVVGALGAIPELTDIVQRMELHTKERRTLIDRVEHMSRGIPGIHLNQGQDFEGAVGELAAIMEAEIIWDVSDGIPRIRQCTDEATREDLFHSARYASRHAPTNLSPTKSRWYERAPIISRLLTAYDRLRDYPSATGGRG